VELLGSTLGVAYRVGGIQYLSTFLPLGGTFPAGLPTADASLFTEARIGVRCLSCTTLWSWNIKEI
jgi:hypothetical protein